MNQPSKNKVLAITADDRNGMVYVSIDTQGIWVGGIGVQMAALIAAPSTSSESAQALALYKFGSVGALLLVYRANGTLAVYDVTSLKTPSFLGVVSFTNPSDSNSSKVTNGRLMAFSGESVKAPAGGVSTYPSGVLAIQDIYYNASGLFPGTRSLRAFNPPIPGAIVNGNRVGDDAGTTTDNPNPPWGGDTGGGGIVPGGNGRGGSSDPPTPIACSCGYGREVPWVLGLAWVAYFLVRRRRSAPPHK